MKTLIYGCGAVGLGIASCLLKAGVEVDLLGREAAVNVLNRDGLARDGIFGGYAAAPGQFRAVSALADLAGSEYAYILVCTKSFDSEAAAADLAHYPALIADKGIIVLFQNGWGNAEKFTRYFPGERIYNARVITGFTLVKMNQVRITVHADAIHIGSLFAAPPERAGQLCAAVTAGGIECLPTGAIGKDLWAKLLYNCALNPLGAVFDVPYGVLGQYPESREIMDSVIAEVFAVMQAAGFTTHQAGAAEFKALFYGKLIPLTANHKSSTLQDIIAGKKTEIVALNGAVLCLAKQYDIPVPVNRVLYEMVNFKSGMGRPGAGLADNAGF